MALNQARCGNLLIAGAFVEVDRAGVCKPDEMDILDSHEVWLWRGFYYKMPP